MKKAFRFILVFVGCFSLLFCVSCGKKDLSRSEAEKILKQKDFGVLTQQLRIKDAGASYWNGVFNCPGATHQDGTQEALASFKPFEDKYKCLESAGFITLKKEISEPTQRGELEKYRQNQGCDAKVYINLIVNPTPKLDKYIFDRNDSFLKLRLVEHEFGEITGISKNSETSRAVEYTVISKPNELSQCFQLDKRDLEPKHTVADFNLYDDGWRIEK